MNIVKGITIADAIKTLEKKGIVWQLTVMHGMSSVKINKAEKISVPMLNAWLENCTVMLNFQGADDSYEIAFGGGMDFVSASGKKSYNTFPVLDVECIPEYLESVKAPECVSVRERIR